MELIRGQLEEEHAQSSAVEAFDPYIGNTLVSTIQKTTTTTGIGFLAFPMGDVMCNLNLSTVNVSKQSGICIKPVTDPIRVFDTPIQQVVAGPHDLGHLLAVRTYASTNFLRLNKSPEQPAWQVESGTRLTVEDTDGGEVVDIKLKLDCALVVNDTGSLYMTRPFSHKPKVARLGQMSGMQVKDPNFWRLAWDLAPNSGFIISSDGVSAFDLRSQGAPRNYFELKTSSDFLTSVEDCDTRGIIRLCSTNEVFWLDRRNMRSPLLSVRHYRQFDRYLSTTTLGARYTFLSSRRNNLVSVYDVSQSSDQLLHTRGEPSGILLPFSPPECAGQTFVQSPFVSDDTNATVLKLTSRGAIFGCTLSSEILDESVVAVKYTSALRAIEGQVWDEKDNLMAEQDRTQLDMSPAYEKLFLNHTQGVDRREEEEASQVYELLDLMPGYFQKTDAVSEQMLTTYDIAFRAGDEPKDSNRSDFLTGSVLSSQRGFRAIRQGRLDPTSLVTQASWHMDLAPTLQQLGLPGDSLEGEGGDPFTKFNLIDGDSRTGPSLRLEKRSREQLEVDLRLSRNVFSAQPFVKLGEVDQSLETMTEALSLGDGPPDVDFGYLQPTIGSWDGCKVAIEGLGAVLRPRKLRLP
ncbi:hypothetical protein NMY22_g4089 [Coprinellus aureogranulatus]|nr:hypothetical protein NMY22_g4089 [Coprinellus aureogranulatus]